MQFTVVVGRQPMRTHLLDPPQRNRQLRPLPQRRFPRTRDRHHRNLLPLQKIEQPHHFIRLPRIRKQQRHIIPPHPAQVPMQRLHRMQKMRRRPRRSKRSRNPLPHQPRLPNAGNHHRPMPPAIPTPLIRPLKHQPNRANNHVIQHPRDRPDRRRLRPHHLARPPEAPDLKVGSPCPKEYRIPAVRGASPPLAAAHNPEAPAV